MPITIEELPVTSLAVGEHKFPAMKDGLTVGVTGQQVADLAIGGASLDYNTLGKAEAAIIALQEDKANAEDVDTHGLTAKTTPVDDDEFRIADSAASWAFKRLTLANLRSAIFGTKLASALLQDQKASGTSGGATTTGWQTRTLNTEVFDPDGLVTLSSNQFTPAFDCDCEFETAAAACRLVRSRIYNVTDSVAVAGQGLNAFGETGSNVAFTSRGRARLVGGKTYRLEMYASNAVANGLGLAVSSGDFEVYSSVYLRRV